MGGLMHQQPQQTVGGCRITGETCFKLPAVIAFRQGADPELCLKGAVKPQQPARHAR